jgi:diguanylate cyclase
MAAAEPIKTTNMGESPRRMYERIGAFLFEQRLDPVPANYTFAYHLLSNPEGPLARAVSNLTDGGIRLTQRDIDGLRTERTDPNSANGGKSLATLAAQAVRPTSSAPEPQDRPPTSAVDEKTHGLVAATHMQVEGFEVMVNAMLAETEDFGRNLAASAAAIDRTRGETENPTLNEVAEITATMLDRVRAAEERLDSATREASELRKKLEEARDTASRDPLTHLPNRRAFEEGFAAQAATGAKLCLAVCDVDHFKSVNDRFGHTVGDGVLRAIAGALAEECAGHLVARYGGEEFAVLFTGLDLAKARATLDAARLRVQRKRYRLRNSDEPLGEVTFSAGITVANAQESLVTTFQRADELCYAAKGAGRNRIHYG